MTKWLLYGQCVLGHLLVSGNVETLQCCWLEQHVVFTMLLIRTARKMAILVMYQTNVRVETFKINAVSA